MTRQLWLLIGVAAIAACPACASYATLGTLSVGGRSAPEALASLKINAAPATPGMQLKKGDVIETDSETAVQVNFVAGEAVLFPGTRVRIDNTDPDLFAWFGKLWLHGLFGTSTNYVTAASEGTEYLIEIEPTKETATVTVLEGRVRLDSRVGAWGGFVAGQGERVNVPQLGAVTRSKLDPAQYNLLLRELNGSGLSSSFLVPEVRGLALADARTELERDRLTVADVTPMPVEASRVGLVVSQSPEPGQRSLTVRLGVGAEAIRVPNLVGLPQDRAPSALQAVHLQLGRVTLLYSGARKPGIISGQGVAAGNSVLGGQAIDVTVEAEPVRVPSLVGQHASDAAALLARSGLLLGKTSEVLSEGADSVVLAQDPAAERQVGPGSVVNITIARGGVRVPNLVELSANVALLRLSALGLLGNAPDPSPGAEAALYRAAIIREQPTVDGQDPAPGTLVLRGSSIKLHYTGALCTVPDATHLGPPPSIQQAFAQAGLAAQVVEQGTSTGKTFGVSSQSATAGSQIRCSSTVVVHGTWKEMGKVP